MVHLYILPGNNESNKEWAEEVAQAVQDLFENIQVQSYAHWKTGEKTIHIDDELRGAYYQLADTEDYALFAKSAGIMVALRGIYEGKLAPKLCIFVGFPIHFAERNNLPFTTWLTASTVPILFIQNNNDPAANETEITTLVKNLPHHQLIILPADTHDYLDLTRLREEIRTFIKTDHS